jgi:hypothetical protein
MKSIRKVGAIIILIGLLGGINPRVLAQSFEAEQLLLDYQKLLQEKQILDDLYKGYQILSAGYTAIRDVSKGNFDLHKAFLDGLLAVSPVVRNYKRVADIINLQLVIVQRYKSAWARFQQDEHFTPGEIEMMGNMFAGLFDQTVKNLTTLSTILTDGALRASDAERLQQIDGLYVDMQGKSVEMDAFNNKAELLSLQRAKEGEDQKSVRLLYGL